MSINLSNEDQTFRNSQASRNFNAAYFGVTWGTWGHMGSHGVMLAMRPHHISQWKIVGRPILQHE